MPTYEFKCTQCDTTGTTTLSIDQDISLFGMRCPRCSVFMDRVYSAPALHFKGSGWGGQK